MRKASGLALAVFIAAFSLCASDLTIVYKSTSKGMGTNQESTVTHHYSSQFHKSIDPQNQEDSLVDYTQGIVYTIKHKDKKIEKTTFEDLMAAAENAKKQMEGMAELPGFLKGMMGAVNGSVKVEKLGSETVAGRTCKRFKLSIGKIVQEVSMDESLKMPVPAKAYARHLKLKAFAVPGMTNMAKIYEELSKLKGVSLRNTMKGFMGIHVDQIATEVSTKSLPASTFTLPKAYSIEDMGQKLKNQEE